MALAYSIKRRGSVGDLNYRVVDITLDNSYTAGGWPVTAQLMGFGMNGTILFALVQGGQGGYLLQYDHTTNKVRVFQGDNANAAAAPAVELAGTSAVMNAVIVRLMAFGIGHG